MRKKQTLQDLKVGDKFKFADWDGVLVVDCVEKAESAVRVIDSHGSGQWYSNFWEVERLDQ